ncbi:putative membrane protein [Escherichia coli 4-203-08_S3_C2]|nr:putative membrane protein [Escherichia coli 4-203-08_S3_C3]KEL05829.1 putative membrane protein [Escherichia coli 4-203-08_S3_C2]KEM14249.1 putative membrane protein [Escherichia coli 6-175-07_S4_C2]KEM86685.1 putative membrane protein [Escherichia coli 6-537-08_S4_C1]
MQDDYLHHKALFRKSVMIGFGVLIQMKFTLSMVNRFYGA